MFLGLQLEFTQGLSESLVKLQGDNWFWELVKVASKDICSIVDRISSPIQAFPISLGRVKNLLKVFDPLRGPV